METDYQNYSVLLTVYAKETPENFRAAMVSMLEQTVATNDFVVVCDGDLTPELDGVLEELTAQYPDVINVYRFPKNPKWSEVLNKGLEVCKNELVARMDSDDISVKDRCEKELNFLRANPHIDVVGSDLGEFSDNPDEITNIRHVPTGAENIRKFAKYRSPINHATVIYKKSAVMDVGGYEYYSGYYEDYQLWIKLMLAGKQQDNISEVLYLMRAGADLYRRRGGKRAFHFMKEFKKWLYKNKILNFFECWFLIFANGLVVMLPSGLRGFIYKKLLRKKKSVGEEQ